jgi:serine/threonine-protein kinase HipA
LESKDGDMLLSPSYDLMNTKLHIQDPQIAMNLFKEMERTKEHLFSQTYNYRIDDFIELGKRLEIKERIISSITDEFRTSRNPMLQYINKSFLSDEGKQKYINTVEEHFKQLFK